MNRDVHAQMLHKIHKVSSLIFNTRTIISKVHLYQLLKIIIRHFLPKLICICLLL